MPETAPTEPAPELPDVLDLLGLPIAEVGCAHVCVEWAKRWPSGAGRVAVVVQGAFSGALLVDVKLSGAGGVLAERQVALADGEVRRLRLPFQASEAGELKLSIKAPVPAGASRIRPVWFKPAPSTDEPSVLDALWTAIKQAVGAGPATQAVVAPPERELPVTLAGSEGEPPVATEEEAVWQKGMAPPPPTRIAFGADFVKRPVPAPAPVAPPPPAPAPTPAPEVSASDPSGAGAAPAAESKPAEPPPAAKPPDERVECPSCHEKFYKAQVRGEERCPGCGNTWLV